MNISPQAIDLLFLRTSYALSGFLVLLLIGLSGIMRGVSKRNRRFEPFHKHTIYALACSLPFSISILYGIYLIPGALAGISWKDVLHVSPLYAFRAMILFSLTLVMSYIVFILLLAFPDQNKYKNSLPQLAIISIISGIANTCVIIIITKSFYNQTPKTYLLYYLIIAFFISVSSQKYMKTRIVKLTNDIVYELRMNLVSKLLSTKYQYFEELDTGQIYATLNNDTEVIGNSASLFVGIINSAIILLGVFVYLLLISLWATISLSILMGLLACLYLIVTKMAKNLLEQTRDTQNVFMKLMDGLVMGFKELSLHTRKKHEFARDLESISDLYRQKKDLALVKFINVGVFGGASIVFILAVASFFFPVLFPKMQQATLLSFVMMFLYVIGPMTTILNSVPNILGIKISWRRIQQLLSKIPESKECIKSPQASGMIHKGGEERNLKEGIKVEGLMFGYESKHESERFALERINFEAKAGEIIFIVGGNGSGKTTVAKLLTGLYIPEEGAVKIDGRNMSSEHLGEYFSVVFSDFHLFEKLYAIDTAQREEEIQRYLKLLRLEKLVDIKNGAFTAIKLSGGQRKRLALLKCYLEDRPIYLFDELAADQDPEFREFFYTSLLLEMKRAGKIVIAITHDDHYFHVADRIIKMDMGRMEYVPSWRRYHGKAKSDPVL
ncbi:MAG: cyclic peptide export ABC transporter [bacterium]